MAAKVTPLKASGLKHIAAGHYAAKVNGKNVLVKLPNNVSKPEEGDEIEIYPDWLVNEVPELSDVQKEYFAKVKEVGGENMSAKSE